ncbi:MAG TPA: DUF523 and DUF1722 domain-containing protein [Trebonia sp.]|nr:DUF523 and DUF1722 domain-containing protein [Trebonia sp.]
MSEAGTGTGRDASVRPRVGVSSCLLGEPVRFNGGHSHCRFLADELGPYVDWVPYCPEMEIGLGTPRETLRLTADGRLVSRSGGADHTAAMAALPLPAGLDGYVFKAKSPSCGVHGIARYAPGGQPSDHRGRGVFAQRMIARFPLLPAEDEWRLNDAVLREEFTERVFAFARLRGLFAALWEPRGLVSFHARHKLQLLAHDPARYRRAGRVVATAGSAPREVTEAAYRDVFQAAMTARASRSRNANALHHAFSRISRELGDRRRADLLSRIESYRRGTEPLSVPIAILAHYASDGEMPWLAGQTYLAPFPDALRLRHSVPR